MKIRRSGIILNMSCCLNKSRMTVDFLFIQNELLEKAVIGKYYRSPCENILICFLQAERLRFHQEGYDYCTRARNPFLAMNENTPSFFVFKIGSSPLNGVFDERMSSFKRINYRIITEVFDLKMQIIFQWKILPSLLPFCFFLLSFLLMFWRRSRFGQTARTGRK